VALGEVLAEISAHLEDASEERLGENGKRPSVAIRRAFRAWRPPHERVVRPKGRTSLPG
jgi:hypothetical protein